MKRRKEDNYVLKSKTKEVLPRPLPPPPLLKFRDLSRQRAEESVTKRELAKFWRQKKIEEEDHLLAAIKAAARLRARNLTANGVQEQEYQSFELSLKTYDEDDPKGETAKKVAVANDSKTDEKDKEVHVGIKDWWRKGNYAYLNH